LGSIKIEAKPSNERPNVIIWSGFGFLPVFFLLFFGGVCCINQTGPPGGLPLALAFLLAGLASGFLGCYLRRKEGRTVVDKATGKEFSLHPSHSLFFIPMPYWGVIFIGVSLYLLLQTLFKR
jgi:hypothetical protein